MRSFSDTVLSQVSTNANQSSSPIDASQLFAGSVQGVATGTPTGNLKVQASNDNGTPANWSDVSGLTVAVSAAGVVLIPKFDLAYKWIKLVYTGSGVGTLTANFNGVGF